MSGLGGLDDAAEAEDSGFWSRLSADDVRMGVDCSSTASEMSRLPVEALATLATLATLSTDRANWSDDWLSR